MFPDSSISKDFKCGRTKVMAVLKVIAHGVWIGIVKAFEEPKYFSLQTDKTTDVSVTQQMAIMLRFSDNAQGTVRCVFYTRKH